MNNLEPRIEEFKKRIELDGAEFCRELYDYATTRILAHKYVYYNQGQHFISDDGYDIEEQCWYVMGRALGLLNEDETSPCVGFDEKHPLAEAAKKLVDTLVPRKF